MKSKEYIRCINCEYNEACFLQSVAPTSRDAQGILFQKRGVRLGK